MELREANLQRTGNSLYCTLPASWIKHHRLGRGKAVRLIVDEENRLIIEPAGRARA